VCLTCVLPCLYTCVLRLFVVCRLCADCVLAEMMSVYVCVFVCCFICECVGAMKLEFLEFRGLFLPTHVPCTYVYVELLRCKHAKTARSPVAWSHRTRPIRVCSPSRLPCAIRPSPLPPPPLTPRRPLLLHLLLPPLRARCRRSRSRCCCRPSTRAPAALCT
jgi:hypothetical protein